MLGTPLADCCGGVQGHGANYLGPEHAGVQLSTDPADPLPFAQPDKTSFARSRRAEFALLGKLNRLAGVEYPDDPALPARIPATSWRSRCRRPCPKRSIWQPRRRRRTQLYGLDQNETQDLRPAAARRPPAGRARRAVRAGLSRQQRRRRRLGRPQQPARRATASSAKQVDQPIAGLLNDLKQRGLLDETLVVIGTEFGRTPGAERANGRDHHPYGFSVALAGGGIKGGIVHGATDELGFHAVENRHYVTDIHATVLHLLGLDHRRLEIPGRKRLEIDFGKPIREIMA